MARCTFSIRSKLGLVIIFMGLLAILLALVTGEIYTRLILDNYRAAIGDLARLKSQELLENLKDRSSDLAMALQQPRDFQRAFAAHDGPALEAMLNDQFFQYLHTTGMLKLERLEIYSPTFELFVTSSEKAYPPGIGLCPALVAQAAARQGKERLKTFEGICLDQGRAYHAVIMPMSIPRPKAYIAVFCDPAFNLREVETGLALPVQISGTADDVLYRSPEWLDERELRHRLLARYELPAYFGDKALTLLLLSDIRPLDAKLQRTRNVVVGFSCVVIGMLVLVALALAQRNVIGPLQTLTREVRNLRFHSDRLGKPIEVCGSIEISQLAASFNQMSAELAQLQHKLEKLAYIDTLTELPNRVLFYHRLSEVTKYCRLQCSSFALFMIDLNRFKEVNDTLGHHVGDALLQAVGERLRGLLRRSDTILHIQDQISAEDQTIARLGGDEFVVIAPLVSKRMDAERIAHKLQELVSAEFAVAGHKVTIGMSIGIAFYPEDSDHCEALMQYADQAMYIAKERQCEFVFYGAP